MNKLTNWLFLALLFYGLNLLLLSCGNEKNTKKPVTETPVNTQPVYQKISPDFNADTAYAYIVKQLSFGARVTNTPEHKACGDWLVKTFKKHGMQVTEQKGTVTNWDGKKLNIRNIIASHNPTAQKRILICAHWDSRPYADEDPNPANHNKPILAADDGASGVAVMLELARIINQTPLDFGVDFICFDAEDLGKSEHENSYCLGSQYWGANPHIPGYKAQYGILLDMVGAAGARFAWEEVSVAYAEPILRKVWDTAIRLNYGNYFYYVKRGGITDDHYYVNKLTGIPTIDIINTQQQSRTGFAHHWHTLNDDIQIIDRNTLAAVGNTLLEVLYNEK